MPKNNQTRLLVAFYAAVGGFSLIFQTLWQRELALITGNTLKGISLVVGGWMAGYAVGNIAAGKIAHRGKALFWLALSQIAVMVLALLFIPWFSFLQRLPLFLVYFGAFGSVFIPAISWGMGLPILGEFLGDESLSSLYGWNTLASGLSVLLVDFFLLPILGARFSLIISVAVGIIFFGMCLLLIRTLEREFPSLPPREFKGAIEGGKMVLLLFGISGFTSLGYQLIYNRQLLYFTGNTIYCYGVITAVFILGLAVGSLFYHRYQHFLQDKLWAVIGWGEIIIGLWHIAFPLLSLGVNATLVPFKGGSLVQFFLLRFLSPTLLIGVPVLTFGFLYPAFLALFHKENKKSLAIDTALAGFMNTLGSVIGIGLVAFFMIGLWGISGTLRILAWVSTLIGILALARGKRLFAISVGVGIFLVSFLLPWQDKIGQQAAREFQGSTLLYYKEGIHGTVSVAQHPSGILHLKINGVGEVPTDYNSLRVFRFLGYMPFVFFPSATNVLVIAFGGGITFGSIMEVPGVVATNVEICADVLDAARFFTNFNHNVLEKHRGNILIDDGYTYLLRASSRYDLIIADATHPASGDSWVLYTRDFYHNAHVRLKDGGIMAQWVPLHGLLTSDLQVILRTFSSEFSYTKLAFCNEYLVLFGSDVPFDQTEAGWQRLWQNPTVQNDLRSVHLSPTTVSNLIVWESSHPPLWESSTPLAMRDHSPLQFSELWLRGKDTRVSSLEFLLRNPVLSKEKRLLLEFQKDFFLKDYIAALARIDEEAPLNDDFWQYQKQKTEEIFLLSLRNYEGLQRCIDSTNSSKYTILRRLEKKDPLFVGVALALFYVQQENYQEASRLLEGLVSRFPEDWLKNIYQQVKRLSLSNGISY